jgi:hypothetical protein
MAIIYADIPSAITSINVLPAALISMAAFTAGK